MPKYTFRREYQVAYEVDIEAGDEQEAWDAYMALEGDGEEVSRQCKDNRLVEVEDDA